MTQGQEKYEELIRRTIRATEEGRIRWKAGIHADSFVTMLKIGGIRIEKSGDVWRNDEGVPEHHDAYIMSILDENGTCGERLSNAASQHGSDCLSFPEGPLRELFRCARASATDVSGLVDSLIFELA
jgi:hypothetical protein